MSVLGAILLALADLAIMALGSAHISALACRCRSRPDSSQRLGEFSLDRTP